MFKENVQIKVSVQSKDVASGREVSNPTIELLTRLIKNFKKELKNE